MREFQICHGTPVVIIPWICICRTKIVAEVKKGSCCEYQATFCPTCGLETELPSPPQRLSYCVGNRWRAWRAAQ